MVLRPLTIAVALALCSVPAFAQGARSRAAADTPDMKELASYTLTMDTLARVNRVNADVVAALQKDPKFAERIKVSKELAELNAKAEKGSLTDAEQKRMDALQAESDRMDKADEDTPTTDAQSLTEMEKKLSSFPGFGAALKQENLLGRDYAKFVLASMQAGFAAAMLKMTKPGQPAPKIPEGINPANIKFVQEHEADLQKMASSFSALQGVK